MKIFNGKQVLEGLPELVSPAHTAVLVHDMQNDFCTPGGKVFDRYPEAKEGIQQVTARIAELLIAARRAGAMVAFSRASHLPGGETESPVLLHHLLRRNQRGTEPNVVVGTWGHQIIEPLSPQPTELVVDKYSLSAFHGGLLEKVLRIRNIKAIVVTGVASHSGILTSARIATTLDYYVVVPIQCVAGLQDELHQAALKMLEPDVYQLQDVLAAWRSA